ncbi:hypothetical protein MGSAQ_001551 [marine sediment metagenome]|uniref:Uncharacterized protein n=1 Tax=marine sediment metagenome TaxID=412755 RepID=A0A1B6NTZ2_9ZZZZ
MLRAFASAKVIASLEPAAYWFVGIIRRPDDTLNCPYRPRL